MIAPRIPVSVVITCYNLERYIAEAIGSVLTQDYEGPIELIVVDDCSTDDSAAIIRSIGEAGYVSTPRNSGVLLATIAGIEAASHDLIFFLDGDDVWEPAKLSAMCAAFAAAPGAGFMTHDLSYIDSRGDPIPRRSIPEQVMATIAPEDRSEKVREGLLTHDRFVWLGSAFAIRRSLVRIEEFIAFAKALSDPRNTYQDWPLAYWIAALDTVALGYVPQKLFRYRLHELNYSGDAATPEKAVRNFTRTLNTARAMRDIAVLRGLSRPIIDGLEQRIRFCEYVIDLYSGRPGAAARKLVSGVGYIARNGILAKEVARFFGILILGPTRFASLSARRKRLKDLPAS